jgi:hypothetical protein
MAEGRIGGPTHKPPYLKRRIRRRAIRDYRRNEHQSPHYPFNVAPTSLRSRIIPKGNDYSKYA